MIEIWGPIAILGAAIGGGVMLLKRRSPKPEPEMLEDTQEDRIARKVAQVVGCSPADVLPAVRRELDIAPHQSDETLVKRAAYHYRQELPERTCTVYRDSAKG